MTAVSTYNRLKVPIVGDFQIGKSTLVNYLVRSLVAPMGKKRFATTKEVQNYSFGNWVDLQDTPGADDPEPGIVEKTEKALARADAIVFVHSGKTPAEHASGVLSWLSKTPGVPFVFLYNCMDEGVWDPQDADIGEICKDIENELLDPNGYLSRCIPIHGRFVWPVNILWGVFGIGLVKDSNVILDIRRVAKEDLGLDVDSMKDSVFMETMWDRSRIEPVRDLIENLPLEMLRHAASNPQQESDRIVDRFVAELKQRWSAT